MNNLLFQEFLKAAQVDQSVSCHPLFSELYQEVVNTIYQDVSKFESYTFDGRFQDILIRLLRNSKYETEGYSSLLKDLEDELKKLVVTNLMLLPINFIDSTIFESDIKINNYINLFLPTIEDTKRLDKGTLLMRQEQRRKDKKGKMSDNLCRYFEKELYNKLDKEHILLCKDKNFFNYPILCIKINNIDYVVEKESGRIAEAVYSILRIIDFKKDKELFNSERRNNKKRAPADTYVVYYNDENFKLKHKFNEGYFGHSFKFNFSYLLDVDTFCVKKNLDIFTKTLELYVQSCFLDLRKYEVKQLKAINKWRDSISLFDKAYEFASIERYDACALILCALLESLFLKNEGRNKQEKLIESISKYIVDLCDIKKHEEILIAVRSVYCYRNKFIHEGLGYEAKYLSSRSLTSAQGDFIGMKPFEYCGALYPIGDVVYLEQVLKFLSRIIICDKTLRIIEKELLQNAK